MKVSRFVISGARDSYPSRQMADKVLAWAEGISDGAQELVHGCAQGVDTFVSFVAEERGWPIHYVEPEWDKYGKVAGPMRNKKMLEGHCDCHKSTYEVRMLLAFHDNLKRSKGTMDAIAQAGILRIPVLYWGYEVQPSPEGDVDTGQSPRGPDAVDPGIGGDQ